MNDTLKIAQISDTHLFSDKNSLHCGANVYTNLVNVLQHIKQVEMPDAIIFTGDLTQDHTRGSYQQFVNAFQQANIQTPVYFIAGNHDEHAELNHYLLKAPFNKAKNILHQGSEWQILLVNSKSENPSGYINKSALKELEENIDPDKKQLIFMHHHPIDVGYFIDTHGLKNKNDFWQYIQPFKSIKALACGHVHNAISLLPVLLPVLVPVTMSSPVNKPKHTVNYKTEQTDYPLPLYTCPATSIQLDTLANTSKCNGQGAGYRVFELHNDGVHNNDSLVTRTHFLGIKREEVQ